MGERIEIRRAALADAQAMADYTARLVAEKLDTILLSRAYSVQEEAAMVADYAAGQGILLLALANDRVVGMCDLKIGQRPGVAHMGVLGMGVLSTYRGQGIGRRMLVAMIAEARAHGGLCRIELGVTPWNSNAIALYESLGFALEGVKKKAINLRGTPEDDLVMGLVW